MELIPSPPISAFHLRIVVLANHLNGKDTHIRGLRVFGAPAGSTLLLAGAQNQVRGDSEEDEGDENEDEDDASDSQGQGDGRAGGDARGMGMGMGIGAARWPAGSMAIGTSASTSARSTRNPAADDPQSREARAQKEQAKRERRMRKLLRDGGAERVGYTSRAFKMHEVIR